MKNLFLLPLFTILLALSGFTPDTKVDCTVDRSSKLDTAIFHVIRSVPDSSLTNKEAVFSFTFHYGYEGPVNELIQFSSNGVASILKCDKNGKVSVKVTPEKKYKFEFFLNDIYYTIYPDSLAIKPGNRTDINIRFHLPD